MEKSYLNCIDAKLSLVRMVCADTKSHCDYGYVRFNSVKMICFIDCY